MSKPDTVLRLRRERLARGWTQSDVATRTQIYQSHLSLIERGGLRYIPPDWKRRLCRVFRLPEDVLFAVEDVPPEPRPADAAPASTTGA